MNEKIVPAMPRSAAQMADLIGLLAEAASAATSGSTPLWDVLASAVDQALKQPGSRARVARYLGVPRQRITDFTKGRRIPNAETALRLLHWLAATRAGHDPSFVAPPPEETATPPPATDTSKTHADT